jgi:hypothetical protein
MQTLTKPLHADAMDEDGLEVEASKITTLSGHENEP